MSTAAEAEAVEDSCAICISDYKGKRIVKLTCQYCSFHACRGCQQSYLLQTYEDPHCMDCKRGWTADFMMENFTLSFRTNTLRKHRRKILYEREKALLPSMQVFVEAKIQMTNLIKEIHEINRECGLLFEEYDKVKREYKRCSRICSL